MKNFRSVQATYQNVQDDKQLTEGVYTEQIDQGEFDYSNLGYDPTKPGDEHVNVHSMR